MDRVTERANFGERVLEGREEGEQGREMEKRIKERG